MVTGGAPRAGILALTAVLLLLLCLPAGAEEYLTLPDSAEVIEAEAFCGDDSLETVVLPEGVLRIGERAFADSGLVRIALPVSLTEIAEDAFEGLDGLEIIAPENSAAWRWAQGHGFSPAVLSEVSSLPAAGEADQIVLVDYRGGSSALVSRHEKRGGIWVRLDVCRGIVGSAGIGKQREGDRKTPAGSFRLKIPFGIKADPGSRLPYTRVTNTMYWCATSGSPYYNQLCDSKVNGRQPSSADEVLIRYTGYYDYAMFIAYNEAGEEGKGSCIFLHCIGSNSSTGGCVAIPTGNMIDVIRWAGENAWIVIR